MKSLFILVAFILLATGCSPIKSLDTTSSVQRSNSLKVNDKKGWKIFDSRDSSEFGAIHNHFIFQYPADWSIVNEDRGNIELISIAAIKSYGRSPLPSGHLQISIVPEWATGNNDDVGSWCQKQLIQYRNSVAATVVILNQYKYTINGSSAYLIDSKTQYEEADRVKWESDRQVCISKGDTKMGIVARPLESQYLPMLDQILSTLTFVSVK